MGVPGTKRAVPNSGANYWQLTLEMLNNAQVVIHPIDRKVYIPTEPHWYIEGTVLELLSEADSDRHMWIHPDGASPKDRVACEFTPQQPMKYPQPTDHIRVYGILRWDAQHQWWELHPIDHWELLP